MKPTLNELSNEFCRLKFENDIIQETIRRFDLDLELTKRNIEAPEVLEGTDGELVLLPTAYPRDPVEFEDEEEG